jgi:hypothetical protein
VVLLTIVINGSTIGALLRRFGLDKPPVAERLAHLGARAAVLDEVSEKIRQVSRARDLRTVSWDKVEEDLNKRRERIGAEIEEAGGELRGADAAERAAGYWQQVLSVERGAYWSAFGQGTLGARATRVLNKEIDIQVDLIERGECRPPDTRMPELNDPASALARLLRRANIQFGSLHFEHLSLIYDLSRAESMAAEKVLSFIDSLKGVDPSLVEDLRETYRRYLRVGKERLEDLRTNLPEMTQAIETRLAKRVGPAQLRARGLPRAGPPRHHGRGDGGARAGGGGKGDETTPARRHPGRAAGDRRALPQRAAVRQSRREGHR